MGHTMLTVGLTGGIATGKDTVAKMFQELGGHIVDFDQLSRELVEPGKPAWREIVEAFGQEILKADETLDRAKLASIIFDDEDKRRLLERIIHPRVGMESDRRISDIKERDPHAIIFLVVPLLIEVGMHKLVDRVVLVYAPMNLQIKRLMERDGLPPEEAQKRINAQMPTDEKLAFAHFVINNSGSLDETKKQVEKVMKELVELEKERSAGRAPS